jgi:hypothetical protein
VPRVRGPRGRVFIRGVEVSCSWRPGIPRTFSARFSERNAVEGSALKIRLSPLDLTLGTAESLWSWVGLGVSVVLETNKADFMRRGSVGTVSWPGAFGGWWRADPREGSAMVFLAHNMVDLAQMAKGTGLGVWEPIDAFQSACIAEFSPD